MNPSVVVALDLGSSKISCLCVSYNNKKNQEELKKEIEVLSLISKPSQGIRKGTIVEPEKTAVVVKELIKECQQETGIKIDNAIVNINGSHIQPFLSHGTIAVSRADKKISQDDLERVMEAAQTFSLPNNREILDALPKEYIVDGEKEIKHPLGMEGTRLEVEILALTGFGPYLRNLEKTIKISDLEIEEIFFSPLASAEAVLTPKEKELGALLLDFGAGTTSFIVFQEGVPVFGGVVPIGSQNLTKDLAVGLKVNFETAERIKLDFGSCCISGNKKIKIKEGNGEELIFSQKTLGKIIDCRIIEIFDIVQKELKKANIKDLPGGLVITGGGAKLAKINDLAKKRFNLYSRIGQPKQIPSLKDPAFSCVVGLALLGLKNIKETPSPLKLVGKIKNFLKQFLP